MGIDVYLKWDGMTGDEEHAQCTGFSTVSGDVGYLREAYHGQPYATHELIVEEWDDEPEDGWAIPNVELIRRLPKIMEACIERHKKIYHSSDEDIVQYCKAYIDFINLHNAMEKAGRNPRIHISY